jgi:hypothetical protein
MITSAEAERETSRRRTLAVATNSTATLRRRLVVADRSPVE